MLPAWLWLVAGLVFLGIEMTRGDFYLFGIGIGALLAAVETKFLGLPGVDWVVFVAASVGMVVSIRPMLWSWLHLRPGRGLPTPVERLIGRRGEVIEAITADRSGVASLGGQRWLAQSMDGMPIPVGTVVEVFGMEGTTLTVLPVEVLEQAGKRGAST